MDEFPNLPREVEKIMTLLTRMKNIRFWEICPELNPSEAMVLHYLCPEGKDKMPAIRPVQLSVLTEELHMIPASVSRLMKSMEEQGLVRRYTDPRNRRNTIVEATPQGLEIALICKRRLFEYWHEVFDRIPPDDWHTLLRIFSGLTNSMEAVLGEYKQAEKAEHVKEKYTDDET